MTRQEMTRQEVEQYYNGSAVVESNNSHICSFKCGTDGELQVYAWIEANPSYVIYYWQTDWYPIRLEHLWANNIESLLVHLCKYCLNHLIVLGEKEIKYNETASSYFPPIDESKIPYDLIKYFDIPRQERRDKEDESI